MATIREIAELAGVSRGTVDRVLNNRGSVNKDTREKILELAKALDYKPNRAGLVLAAQKKNLKIGVILFGIGNPFFDEVIRGVKKKRDEFASYNCSVIIRRIEDNVKAQLDAINELLEEGINGLAISPYNDTVIANRLKDLSAQSIPIVTFNTDIEDSKRLAYVGSNYYLSGQTAAGLMSLMTGGDVNCGIITGSNQILCHTERIAGFCNRITEEYHNIKITDTVVNGDDDFVSYDKTTKLLNAHPEINALFFAAGGVYGGCRAVTALGLEKKIRIICFDEVGTTLELIKKSIIAATICQQPYVQGSKPLDILFSYLTTGELPKKEINYVDVDIRIKENI